MAARCTDSGRVYLAAGELFGRVQILRVHEPVQRQHRNFSS